MADKLKRCPFCGGEARILTDMQDTTTPVFSVVCDGCESITYFGDVLNKEETIKAWNKRANPWHTGTPTEEGWYIVVSGYGFKGENCDAELGYWKQGSFHYTKYFDTEDIVEWQKIKED